MEVVTAIVGTVVGVLVGRIPQKLRNLTSSADRVKKMIKKWQVLDGQRTGIENRMRENEVNNRKIPHRVRGWLEEVENIKEDVDNIPSNNIGCFNIKKKYLAGRNALRVTVDIEGLIKESSGISSDTTWLEPAECLGRVNSETPASSSTPGVSVFNSRVKTFNDALKLLKKDDDTARVIALCGMGGVGKTTLKNQLKEVAKKEKMFDCIADVDIGNTPNLLKIQKQIAVKTGDLPSENDLMATYLSTRFEVLSKQKQKTLVILDDVWEKSKIKLEDIGLASPLPNGVKLLLTSRDVQVCRQIADDANSALEEVKVGVLKENEAQDFFCEKAGISAEGDHDLYKIGCEIVKKCGYLPLAIKLIAGTVKCRKNRNVWEDALDRLKINDLDDKVQEIIEMSYNNLKQEDKAIFLLCGLFPEDSNIPIEDLTRYAKGLNLLNQVSTMERARNRTITSVSNLKDASLLMDGDSDGYECVKMHDLVLAFVVNTVSKGGEDGCWIIHHEDDFSNWSEANSMSQSCKRISLTCKDMSKFPSDLRFPNLSLLKLMHGDESLRFPQGFYEGMEQLQVIAFEKLEHPLIPTPVQFSSNLRTLCLHECSLTFDLACIGNLSNLEVLSFANSGITTIPSTFRNLKKLRLLDVTGCCNLVIDDGVLKSLVKLEELYMIPPYDEKACCFTDNNSELAERSKNLCALELEFTGNNAHMKNMSCEKLKRFKLSVGCSFTEVRDQLETNQVNKHSYENSLKLVTNKEELLKSKINKLFQITHALYLQVNDMNSLEDVEIPHPPPNSSFSNLRILVVSQCAELTYLFTPSVATNLSKLEYLDISECPNMKAVIHTKNIFEFSKLKYLRLADLPKLSHFCNKVDVIELPRLMELRLKGLPNFTSIYPSSASSSVSSNISCVQSFFHKEDATPILEELVVSDMENLKEIWPPQFSISNVCPLRELTVQDCGSIEVLLNMDFGESEQLSSSLRSINVWRCDSLVKLFSCNPFPFLNNLQELDVYKCRSIQVLFNTDLGRAGKSEEQVCSSSLRSIKVSGCDSLVKLFSCNPFPFLNNLQELEVYGCGSIQVLFNTDLGRAGKSEELVCSSSLRSIKVSGCDSLVNLLPSNPMPVFNHLEELNVESCASIEVIFDIDMGCVGETDKVSSSRLRSIELEELGKLREVWRIKDGGNNLIHGFEAVESIHIGDCERFENLITPATTSFDMRALKEIKVWKCDSLMNLLPRNPMPLFNHLEELEVTECASIEVIFNIDMGCVGEMDKVSSSRLRSIDLYELGKLREVWRIKDAGNNNLIHGFESVEIIQIQDCERFENYITPATTNLDMRALKEVTIGGRKSEKNNELVEKEKEISKIAFPSSLLPTFHNLHKLVLWEYKDVEVVFEITSPISRESPHNTQQQLIILPNLEELNLCDLKKMSHVWKCNWNELFLQKQPSQSSFHNLTTIKMSFCNSIKYLFSPLMVKLLSSLKEIDIKFCNAIEEVVSNRDDISSCDGIEEIVSHTAASVGVVFPRLKSLSLSNLPNFVGFFLGKNEFKWPALEEVEIRGCPQITVFTYGQSTAPELKFINTSLGKHSVECGLNFHVTTTSHQARLPSSESSSSYHPTTMKRLPWSHHNLIEVDMYYNPSGGQTLFSSDEVSQLQKLETVRCSYCRDIEQIFDSQTDAEIPNLRQVDLKGLYHLKYIWKSKQGTVLKFPNLTRLSIDRCGSLEYVFTCPMVGSLLQLQELRIEWCSSMKVIVKGEEEEECDAIVNAIVVFPCLKSLKLDYLESLEGFCLGKEAFEFPSLDTLEIRRCSKMTVFTKGDLSAPMLHAISKGGRKYNIQNRLLNSFF